MRLLNVITCDQRPRFRCGAAVGSAALAGGTSLLGSGLDYMAQTEANETNERISREQLQAQREENQVNRDWQTEQAEIARQFTTGERLAQEQHQLGVLDKQQEYNWQNMQEQARLNSPVYQSQELVKARLNPQVYFGRMSSFAGSSLPSAPTGGSVPSGASSPMPGSVQGLSPVPLAAHAVRLSEGLKNVGSLIESLSSSAKQNAEAKEILGLLTHKIKEQLFKADEAESQAAMAKLSAAIQEMNFPVTLKKAVADYEHVVSEILLNREKRETEKTQQALNKAYESLQGAIEGLTNKQKEKLGLEMPYVVSYIQASVKEKVASANASNASAEQSRANAAVLNEEKRIRTIVADIREAGKTKELQSVLDGLDAKQAISQEQYKAASLAIKKINAILETYGRDAGRKEMDAEIENLMKIIGLHTGISINP